MFNKILENKYGFSCVDRENGATYFSREEVLNSIDVKKVSGLFMVVVSREYVATGVEKGRYGFPNLMQKVVRSIEEKSK